MCVSDLRADKVALMEGPKYPAARGAIVAREHQVTNEAFDCRSEGGDPLTVPGVLAARRSLIFFQGRQHRIHQTPASIGNAPAPAVGTNRVGKRFRPFLTLRLSQTLVQKPLPSCVCTWADGARKD